MCSLSYIKYFFCMIVSENDRRYLLTEKFVHDELMYVTCLKSAKELYGEPLRRMEIFSVEEYDLMFDKLSKLADECYQLVKEVSKLYFIKLSL